jgi:repressor LexA
VRQPTERQMEIYNFIAEYYARHEAPPEQRQICQHFQLFRTTVSDHVQALERKGLIKRKGRGYKNNLTLV